MREPNGFNSAALDRYITGNYGEDQYRDSDGFFRDECEIRHERDDCWFWFCPCEGWDEASFSEFGHVLQALNEHLECEHSEQPIDGNAVLVS